MHLEFSQWLMTLSAAVILGVSKTALPGAGILVSAMLASAFGGWASAGIMLPMLILSDCLAVASYHEYVKWHELVKLVPSVILGMGVGAVALWVAGHQKGDKDTLSIIIGVLLLMMLAAHFVRCFFPERLTPISRTATTITGVFAGFATIVSNAAGPVMSVYMAARGLTKNAFMGTLAWYFLILNTCKLPVYIALTAANPAHSIITVQSFLLVLYTCPGILLGAFLGKWLLPRFSQRLFENIVLILAGIAAMRLILR
ncbi:MAG: TSUP family transporter [Armatimonadota bacterium]